MLYSFVSVKPLPVNINKHGKEITDHNDNKKTRNNTTEAAQRYNCGRMTGRIWGYAGLKCTFSTQLQAWTNDVWMRSWHRKMLRSISRGITLRLNGEICNKGFVLRKIDYRNRVRVVWSLARLKWLLVFKWDECHFKLARITVHCESSFRHLLKYSLIG